VKRERELTGRLRSLDALAEAVSAMKSLSAHHLRESRAALDRARPYRDGVERIAAAAGAHLPTGAGATGLVVLGAELGLCGGYHARLVADAAAQHAALGGPVDCIGRRTASLMAARGLVPASRYPAPASVAGISQLLLHLVDDLVGRVVDGELASVVVVSRRFLGVGRDQAVATRLFEALPPDADRAAPVPRYESAEHLARAGMRELVYSRLHELVLEALASEHGARLVATQSAEQWLDRERDQLGRQLVAVRHEASTQEMLEIAAGVRASARAHAQPR
jgi:F-type H+-transporting ATPase subunit gamma